MFWVLVWFLAPKKIHFTQFSLIFQSLLVEKKLSLEFERIFLPA